jgi:hypothetical protein
MKKVLALMAVVAMIAVSSVAYAQTTDPVVVTGEVNATQTITGCDATITGITPTTKPAATCQSTYTTNDTSGYRLSFSSSTSDLASATVSDSIAGLDEGTTGDSTIDTCPAGGGSDCFSWYLSNNSQTSPTIIDDSSFDQGPFNAGEHAVETTAEEFLNESAVQVTGATVTQTFYATVDDTTKSATDYTNNATIQIATY